MFKFVECTQLLLRAIDNEWRNKMQFTTEKALAPKTPKESAISVPNTLYTSRVLGSDIEIDKTHYTDNFTGSALMEVWNQQHPLIHTWLLISSISICFLSAILFVIS